MSGVLRRAAQKATDAAAAVRNLFARQPTEQSETTSSLEDDRPNFQETFANHIAYVDLPEPWL